MGNTDSQYSNFNVLGKPKPCSLKFQSIKEEVLSPHSWWRGSEGGGQGYKTRGKGGRVCQQKITHNQPYGLSQHYEHHITKEGSGHNGYGFLESSGENVNGLGANGQRTPEMTSLCEPIESRSSPKVLLSKDGSMRVEFTNARRMSLEPQGLSGHSHNAVAAPEPSLTRTSKGSSLSSEGSWYDSPWGNTTEHNDNVFTCSQTATRDNSSGYTTYSSTRTEETGCGYNTFSSDIPQYRASLASVLTLDVVDQEESSESGDQCYSSAHSHTLPCRRVAAEPTPIAVSNSRKDNLKSRIQRLSDWTGSLSRKKRRLQETYGSEASEGFIIGVDPGLGDSSSQVTGPVWNSLHTQTLSVRSGFSRGQQSHSDALRQNIYENFMQELETGGYSGTERTDSGSGSLGSLEQLDLLFEKEQGVVRRAGWLSIKPLLTLHKDRKLELVARRKWRQYWVTLKGCTLLFYETYGKSSCPEQELSPHYALLAEDSIVQAIPEHPKKENVFCLSNGNGDVYLLQAANQTDLENWVTAIHSASASLLAKRQGKEDTVRLLRSQTSALLQKIDMDSKMKKMAELQLSVISDQRNRKAIKSQIQQWEQNLEKFNMDLFRMRCYLASLQGSELPNPKSLLAVAGRPSKTTLGRLGIFSVSSFHALICTRDEATLRRRCQSLSRGTRNKKGIFSSLKGLDSLTKRSKEKRQSMSQVLYNLSTITLQPPYNLLTTSLQPPYNLPTTSLQPPYNLPTTSLQPSYNLPTTALQPIYNFTTTFLQPAYNLPLPRLRVGDEILFLNGTSVSSLDMGLMHLLFSHKTLHLLLRREDTTTEDHTSVWPDCGPWQPAPPSHCGPWQPAPPSHCGPWLTGIESTFYIKVCGYTHILKNIGTACSLNQTFPEGRGVAGAVVVEGQRNPYSMEPPGPQTQKPPYPRHMSISERLCKVIQELVDTEKSYVKDLGCLFDIYLTPLQSETFLSHDEMESLFGSLPEMLDFQRVFLHTLEERIASSPNFNSLETPEQFKKLLLLVGGSFLYYADHFKLYSGFCANHIKVQKVLERAKTDRAFKQFLEARNPTKQHSSTLESYLIKPVQRVLKYPLLLRQLVSLTDSESEEHSHLTEALRAMEKVASHINEMQKIYEDYGTVFDQLVAEQSGLEKEVTEISMGEFLIHSSLKWLNPLPSLGRMRKHPELTLFVFKRAVILVYRERSKMRKRMTTSRSGDLEAFKFRWLVPVSAVQVRLGNAAGAESPCIWELVHTKSQVEGRPETVFQLCSSGLESKASVVKALRSLRDWTCRPLLSERGSREYLGSLRRTQPAPVRAGSWRRQQELQAMRTAGHQHHSDDGSVSSSATQPCPGDTHSEPQLHSRSTTGLPSLEGSTLGKRARLCSLTSALEAQLQRLNFTEEAGPRSAASQQEHLRQGPHQPHPAAQRRASSLQGPGRQDNDPQCVDLNALLGRDFSVQSLTSVVNENCFYDTVMGIQKAAIPTL
uniref:TIAM Rac1 associated GEF 2 n=1 Tax=Salmo trutta TaxID=8032 RepID=A0A674C5J6_SALTR